MSHPVVTVQSCPLAEPDVTLTAVMELDVTLTAFVEELEKEKLTDMTCLLMIQLGCFPCLLSRYGTSIHRHWQLGWHGNNW